MKQRSIKRIITFMFALVLMSLCCICANAENDIDIDGAYEFAKDFLSEYYYAKDQNADYDFTTFVESDALLEFANQKAESARYRYIVYETDDKQDYQLEFSLSDTYECDGNVVLDIGVKASFKYKYYDRSSSIGDKTLVMIRCEDGRYTVKDWYTFLDSFDSSIRGEIASLNDPNYWDVSVCAEELTSMLENEVQKSYQYFMLMKEQMADNETEAISVSEEREVLSTTATSYSINKTALVNWATANYYKVLPTSGRTGVVYEDYSKIGTNNWDCTNFASHALLAGGAVMDYFEYEDFNHRYVVTEETYWFMENSNVRSQSWSGVGAFNEFITTCMYADGVTDAKKARTEKK